MATYFLFKKPSKKDKPAMVGTAGEIRMNS